MSRHSGLILVIITVLLSFILIRDYVPNSQKPLPQPENESTSQSLLYNDGQYKLYQDNSTLILLDSEESELSLQVPENDLTLTRKIKYKNTGAAPLIDEIISRGVVLNGKNESYIVGLEPEFKLLASCPLVENNDDHYILIKKSSNQLYYYQKNELVKEYQVSTGKESFYTPEGSFQIANKIPYPRGKDPSAPMGCRWMGLAVPYSADKRGNKVDGGPDHRSPAGQKYGIHGTNDESTIGIHASGGCIRMYNQSVAELYDLVPIGTRVDIIP